MQVWKVYLLYIVYEYQMKTMIFIKLLLCCYIAFRSLTFGASQLASLILGDECNQATYTTSYLPMSPLIEWIRNGNKFSDTECDTMGSFGPLDFVALKGEELGRMAQHAHGLICSRFFKLLQYC